MSIMVTWFKSGLENDVMRITLKAAITIRTRKTAKDIMPPMDVRNLWVPSKFKFTGWPNISNFLRNFVKIEELLVSSFPFDCYFIFMKSNN